MGIFESESGNKDIVESETDNWFISRPFILAWIWKFKFGYFSQSESENKSLIKSYQANFLFLIVNCEN